MNELSIKNIYATKIYKWNDIHITMKWLISFDHILRVHKIDVTFTMIKENENFFPTIIVFKCETIENTVIEKYSF